jgi:GNAT superfamily N-acetyltransferase
MSEGCAPPFQYSNSRHFQAVSPALAGFLQYLLFVTAIGISVATPADAGVVHELLLALARYERLEGEVTATVDDIRALLFGPRLFAEAVIARWQGEPVGLAVFFHNVSTFAGKPGLFLEDLFVKPDSRRRGVGKALLRYVAELAQVRGCRRMEWIALDWNRPALDFYDGVGARIRKGWVVLRLEDAALANLAAANASLSRPLSQELPAV